MYKLCQACGARWTDDRAEQSHYFSSESFPQGSYVSAAQIIALDEDILTCPLDGQRTSDLLGYAHDSFTPAGATMATGDDRYTEGDETHPSKEEL